MSSSSHPLRRAALACLFLAVAAEGLAFAFLLNDDTNLPYRWTARTIPMRLQLGETPALIDGTTYNTSVAAAATNWNGQVGAVQFQTSVTTGTPNENNQLNEVFFAANIFGRDFDDDTLAVAPYWVVGNRVVESDIVFNTKYKFDSYRGTRRFANGERLYDIQRIALHELGHTLGLAHPDEDGQTVTAQMNSHTSDTDGLTADDIQGAQVLYAAPGAVPGNDNFANATVLTLGSGNPVSVTGNSALATREANEISHAGNAGTHSVWFKWTATANGGVTLHTKGSYFNTTLAVYTGAALSNLTLIASNDDIEAAKTQTSLLSFYARSGTTYQFAVDGHDNDAGGLTLSLAFDPNASFAPIIVAQPSSVSVTTGGTASFSVLANGSDPLSYQWNLNGSPIAGATTVIYSIASAAASHAGNYSVTVTNPAGTVTSNSASLTVNAPPPPPPPPPSSGGGGGGAPSLWFCLVLATLGLGRLVKLSKMPPLSPPSS